MNSVDEIARTFVSSSTWSLSMVIYKDSREKEYSTVVLWQGLEILESNEAWEAVGERLEFSYAMVVLRDGLQHVYARTEDRLLLSEISIR